MSENKSIVRNVFEVTPDFHITVIFIVLIQHILSQVFSPEHLYGVHN